MLGKEEPTYRNMEACKCRGQHITPTTKTEGTPYIKGYCPDCKSWVMTEKVFCICCRRRVKHKAHYLRAKRIYNRAVKAHQELVDQYIEKEEIPDAMKMLECPVEYQNTHYNIPFHALVRYAGNGYTRDTMVELQDSIQRVSKYKAKN
jgi:hypothetical protein